MCFAPWVIPAEFCFTPSTSDRLAGMPDSARDEGEDRECDQSLLVYGLLFDCTNNLKVRLVTTCLTDGFRSTEKRC